MPAFSFEKEPFPEASGDVFHFATPALAARLDELCAAIDRGHVLLVDQPGSGKSTMLDSVVESVGDGWRIFRLQVRANQNPTAFVHELVSRFGIPTREPPAAGLKDADTVLESLTMGSQIALIVIDDLHRLGHRGLEQLLYLARRWERYSVRFLIGAEPQLLEQLESVEAAAHLPGSVSTFAMPRFEHEQVSDYLHMCLFRAGLAGDSPFEPAVVDRLTQRSRGLVGAIGPLARGLLDADGIERSGRGKRGQAIARRWPGAVLAAAGVGMVLTVAALGSTPAQIAGKSRPDAEVFQSRITLVPQKNGEVPRDRSAAADTIAP